MKKEELKKKILLEYMEKELTKQNAEFNDKYYIEMTYSEICKG